MASLMSKTRQIIRKYKLNDNNEMRLKDNFKGKMYWKLIKMEDSMINKYKNKGKLKNYLKIWVKILSIL